MRQRNLLQHTSLAGVLALAACSDQSQPSAPDLPADLSRPAQGQLNDANALARSVPGFGGFFYDAQALRTCT